jgi:DNA mismatch endonuclease (patch repair protein)
MGDVFTPEKRSEIMARVRSRGNRATELRLIKIFREYKITGWRRRAPVFGNPDFVFRRARIAVFVDGCFWHSCPLHGSIPGTNRDFWAEKLERNVARDRAVNEKLEARDWRVLRVWQHELRNSYTVACRISDAIRTSKR